MRSKKLLLLLTLSLIGSSCFAQQNVTSSLRNRTIDSLLSVLKTAKEDTNKINTLNFLGDRLLKMSDYEKSLNYSNNAITLCDKISVNSENQKSISAKKAVAYTSIAVVYKEQGNYPDALKTHFIALKIREDAGDKKGIADSYNNIGIVYKKQGNYPEALKNYFASLKIKEELGDKQGCAYSYNNIGNIYSKQKNYLEALKNYSACLKIMKEIGDKQGVASSYNNIGIIYDYKGDYKEALKNYFASLKIKEEIGDKQGMASSNINIGEVNVLIKNYTEARKHLNTALLLSTEIGSKEWIKDSYLALASLDTLLGNWKAAFGYYQRHSEIKDSIFNEEGTRSMAEMQTKYESEKKESEIKLLQKDKEVQGKNLEKQKTIRDAILVGLLLVIVFAVLMYNRFRLIRKQKNIIELKEKETQLQKEVIEEKHKEITDSINYAERIQRSFLATTQMLDKNLKDYFVFFKPKDVVSGDFYWAGELNNGDFAFSCADSTGHGVPGAIMSILNISSLEKSIEQETEPNKILNRTRKIIIERLKKDGSPEGGKDGMDCSLMVINKDRTQLSFAAANNPVFIVRPLSPFDGSANKAGNFELIEFKPDKMPVGKHDKDTDSFSLQTVNIQKGDIIYTLTDGFPDQFGGKNGKKYMIKTLKEFLLQIAPLTMREQQLKLTQEFTSWKGENEQVDDVCIMAVKI